MCLYRSERPAPGKAGAGRNAGLDGVALENEIPDGMEVFADPLITEVFFNLIDNSLRHGEKTTTIRFAFGIRDGNCVVVCEDDGDGVEPGLKEKIFERGFGKNTGFGLFLSREVLGITGITIRERGTRNGGTVRDHDTPGAVPGWPGVGAGFCLPNFPYTLFASPPSMPYLQVLLHATPCTDFQRRSRRPVCRSLRRSRSR